MVNAKTPILESQMIANVKIAIGGGINEPRDALLTILYGLLTNPDQLDAVRADGKWRAAFEEGVRVHGSSWRTRRFAAASSRRATP
jgi:cytochrome P450